MLAVKKGVTLRERPGASSSHTTNVRIERIENMKMKRYILLTASGCRNFFDKDVEQVFAVTLTVKTFEGTKLLPASFEGAAN